MIEAESVIQVDMICPIQYHDMTVLGFQDIEARGIGYREVRSEVFKGYKGLFIGVPLFGGEYLYGSGANLYRHGRWVFDVFPFKIIYDCINERFITYPEHMGSNSLTHFEINYFVSLMLKVGFLVMLSERPNYNIADLREVVSIARDVLVGIKDNPIQLLVVKYDERQKPIWEVNPVTFRLVFGMDLEEFKSEYPGVNVLKFAASLEGELGTSIEHLSVPRMVPVTSP